MTVGSIEKTEIYLKFSINARHEHDREHTDSINKKQKVYYSNIKTSSQNRRINEEKRQHGKLSYAQIKGLLRFGSIMDKRKGITSFDKSVSKFKIIIKTGPIFFVLYVIVVIIRNLIFLKMHGYNFDEDSIFIVMSYDGNYYICNTCDKALRSKRMPCQAVANRLFVEDLPKQFQGFNMFERLLASRRILFKKVTVIPKGKSLKMKRSICNILVTEVDVSCNTLPRPADSKGLLIVKLKCKLEYKSHKIFEVVRTALFVQFLRFLKLQNHLYSDTKINYNNILVDILGCHNYKLEESETYLQILRSLDEPTEVEIEVSTNGEIYEVPLSKFRDPSVETTIISEVPSNCGLEQEKAIAPGEGKQTISVLNDKF